MYSNMPHLVEIVVFIRQIKKIPLFFGLYTSNYCCWGCISYITTSIATLFETLILSFNSFEVCLKFGQMTLHCIIFHQHTLFSLVYQLSGIIYLELNNHTFFYPENTFFLKHT